MFKEFKEFIARGNVIDLAVGIIIGAAFTSIVNSVVEDLINPILGLLTGGMHFRQSIDHALRSRGLSLTPRLQTDAVHHLLQAVGAGLCCAIMPLDSGLEALDSRLTLTPIDNASTLAPLGLILRRDSPRSALGEACFNEARELLQQR